MSTRPPTKAKRKAPASATKKSAAPATTAKKPSARAAGLTVDAYIAALAAPQRAIATTLRALVRREAPGATESIKWGQPVWDESGPFAFLRAARAHVTLGFWRGAELPDRGGLLEGEGDRMRHVKIPVGREVPTAALEGFVREAVRLNRVHGTPTRRS